METLIDKLNNKISKDQFFLDENGSVIREKVKTAAMNLDNHLIDVLINDDIFRRAFFVEKKGILIFDKVKFSWIISNSNFLPDSFTSYKNKIGLIDSNGNFIKAKDDVTLSFPYKDCVLEFDSTDENENRDEIFLNETLSKDKIDTLLAPKAFSKARLYKKNSVEKISLYNNENLLIKGNNLIAMHSILKRFEGKVKLIYWDVLYNTQNDLVPYNDSFKHSSYLTMMKNRFIVAYSLLSQNGVILIHCDKNEDAYLKVLLDEIFTRENYVNSISVVSSTPSGIKTAHRDKTIIKTKDTILVYKKGDITINPQYTPVEEFDSHFNMYFDAEKNIVRSLKDVVVEKGIYEKNVPIKDYSFSNKKFLNFLLENKNSVFQTGKSMPEDIRKISLLPQNKDVPIRYNDDGGEDNVQYAYNGRRMSFLKQSIHKVLIDGEMKDQICKLVCDCWTDINYNNSQNEGGVSLPSGKKPEQLMHRIIEMFTMPGDLILDSYFGTGTTGAVALKLNRKFIGIEQLDSHFDKAVERLSAVINGEQGGISSSVNWKGGGSFISCELIDDSAIFLKRISSSKSSEELVELFDELLSNPSVLNYNIKINEVKNIRDVSFSNLDLDLQKKILIALIDKNTLYVNKSDIEDKEKEINEADIQFTRSFYGE